jgi:hypothetical protein
MTECVVATFLKTLPSFRHMFKLLMNFCRGKEWSIESKDGHKLECFGEGDLYEWSEISTESQGRYKPDQFLSSFHVNNCCKPCSKLYYTSNLMWLQFCWRSAF